MPTVTPETKLILALRKLRKLDQNMPLAQVESLLLISQAKDGISLSDLAKQVDVSMAMASRYVLHFGKAYKEGDRGFDLVSSEEDPLNRRKKTITLTKKGRAFVQSLVGD